MRLIVLFFASLLVVSCLKEPVTCDEVWREKGLTKQKVEGIVIDNSTFHAIHNCYVEYNQFNPVGDQCGSDYWTDTDYTDTNGYYVLVNAAYNKEGNTSLTFSANGYDEYNYDSSHASLPDTIMLSKY